MKKHFCIFLVLLFATSAWAQDDLVDQELQESNDSGPVFAAPENSAPSFTIPETSESTFATPSPPPREKDGNGHVIAPIPDLPSDHFNHPKGPPGGGKFKIEHPGAAQGLISIDKNGYQYKVPPLPKSQAASFRFGSMTSPKMSSTQGISFTTMYPENLIGAFGEYEWDPFRGFGALGLQFGSGLIYARGQGRFGDGNEAREVYSLFIIPASLFVVYRFEYARRQWFVPFVNGGGTYFAMAETRDDGTAAHFAGAPAVAGGGGVHINMTRWSPASSFVLGKEYGVADIWLTLEFRATIGLKSDLDFTNTTASAGFTVDF